MHGHFHIEKASSESERIDGLLVRQERRIQRGFINFVNEARAPHTMREVGVLLAQSNHQGAMAILGQHIASLSNVIPQAIVETGTKETDAASHRLTGRQLAKARSKPITATIAVGFDPSNPRAAASMRASKTRFALGFTDSQQAATRAAVATAFGSGQTLQTATRAFRDSIGLTPFQQQAVDNYRTLLQNGSAEALDRTLRDRRYDPSVERASTTGEPLTAQQIDTMVDRYRDRYIQYRADAISRTEALSAVSEGRHEAFQQIVDQLGVDQDAIERTWNATKDKRTRDSHRAMQGQLVRGMDTPFVSGLGNDLLYPGDSSAPAADIIQCRCNVTYDIVEP